MENQSAMIGYMTDLIELMNKLGVQANITRSRVCNTQCEAYKEAPRVSIELVVESNKEFQQKIGFRHCIQKLLRLEIASSYEGYCDEVKKQHIRAVQTAIQTSNTVQSIENVKNLYTSEVPLNTYYSLLTPTLIHNKKKGSRSKEISTFNYTYMEDASSYLTKHECQSWFDKHSYIVGRDDVTAPVYTMKLMKKETHTCEPVYDIGVANHHMFLANGTVVSNCIPSRMTIAQLLETLLGRLCCEVGALGDGSPFNNATQDQISAMLRDKYGLSPHSNEVLYNGHNGRQMEVDIFMGPCFYQRLRHCSADKLHSRASGPIVMLTRQPAEGRAREGGLRFGEMERDAVAAHGVSEFTKERLVECSDGFRCYVCRQCGLLAIANPTEGIWMCRGCENTTEFSPVQIPYASKLFLQELESMCITSRMITDGRLRQVIQAKSSEKRIT
jgi:ribosomal protein L37AE/L43A